MGREAQRGGEGQLALPMARRMDPDTSHEAAAVVQPHVSRVQQLVLDVFIKRGPMTARAAERLPEFSQYGFSTIRKRISEMHRQGQLVEIGVDRTGRAPCAVYAARLREEES